ncbi:MAG: hypothetical protein AAGK25_05745 [Pseudomonadota bacterium]
MSTHHLFDLLILGHITTGAPGLISFWVPVLSRKGSRNHKFWGKAFTVMMLITGSIAAAMASMTLAFPVTTHPQLLSHPEFSDPALIRGIFGWMMLYLAILTINLAWYGWLAVRNKRDHAANMAWHNVGLQIILSIASVNCAVQGLIIGQWMMVGISFVGFATVGTNLWFMLNRKPTPRTWLLEHIKALIGTGISVYTAFFAFGAVRYIPQLALNPVLWAVPLITGLALIVYHQYKVRQMMPLSPPRASSTTDAPAKPTQVPAE